MTVEISLRSDGPVDLDVLSQIEDRALWLSTAIVDHANRVRPSAGMKVGGHQASSASLATVMTVLWMHELQAADRVSVKPHAAPMLHALEFLLGQLDGEKLTTLREFGGLQAYPSRLKDPVPADYSTGSVGIGATAAIWGAVARRYVGAHFGSGGHGRQWSLVGDAELDEGAVWEAVADPMVAELGELVWIVDLNRQSLDRVAPAIGAGRIGGMFAAGGWQVLTAKYGRRLNELFDHAGGATLRRRIDEMSNAEYQRLLRRPSSQLRAALCRGPDAAELELLLTGIGDDELMAVVRNLGGHDAGALLDVFAQIDDTRPTVIIAYTIKGYGLATEGHPQNHSALLTEAQMRELAARLGGIDLDDPWQRFAADSPPGRICAAAADRLRRAELPAGPAVAVPTDLGRHPSGVRTTQAAVGRTLLDLNRAAPEVGDRVVTVSPDVSSSTNLAGWVNKAGVWSHGPGDDWFTDDTETTLHWREHPRGRHVELGIAEVNLVGLIGELGATWSRWAEPLLPIGVLYDPFVARALEPWAYGMYAGGQSILVGTPSGVTLAAEGGAHQSIITPSIGLEQPGCITYEPAFAQDTEWCLLSALARLGRPDGCSAYLRLSTRPIDQALAELPRDPVARERRRRQVVAGGYVIRRADQPAVTLVGMGAIVPEVLDAVDRLAALGIAAEAVCITSPGLLFRALQSRRGLGSDPNWILDAVLPAKRARPMVTVLDGHPHTLAFLATVNQVAATHLGVSRFGQSGALADVYCWHGIDAVSIVGAALDLVD